MRPGKPKPPSKNNDIHIQSSPPPQKPMETPPQPVAQPNHHPATNVASSSTKVKPEPVASSINQDPAANQQIWNQVVSCLHPPTTQALLKQQCHLISFDGLSAIVGVSSAKLQKITQQKIPNIEAATAISGLARGTEEKSLRLNHPLIHPVRSNKFKMLRICCFSTRKSPDQKELYCIFIPQIHCGAIITLELSIPT